MRKVTEQIKEAFERRQSKKVGNTRTDGMTVWLHGNPIVKRDADGLVRWSLAGWNTPTTRSLYRWRKDPFLQHQYEYKNSNGKYKSCFDFSS